MRIKRALPARSAPTSRPARSSRRPLAAAAAAGLILIAALAGCSGGAASSSAVGSGALAAPAAGGAAAPSAAYASAAASGGVGNGAASSSSGRDSGTGNGGAADSARYSPAGAQLIYTAQLTVRAPSVKTAVSRATSIVSAAGGYVSDENASSGQGQPDQATATVTFKIPVAGYAATLATLSGGGLGTQLSLTQQAQDVTQQVADVGSRVASDQAAIAQLRELLKHAGDVTALLSVQNQINSTESDLESMLAQQNALDHETAFGTVTLTLVGPKAPAKPPAKGSPPPGLAAGLAGGWHALGVTVGWLLTVVGAVAPFAAVAGVVGGLAWWARRRLTRRQARKPA
jgi:hypothetical protein